MKRNLIITIVLAMTFLAFGCKEDNLRKPYGSSSVPGEVTVTNVKPTPGGAIIKYVLPDNDDLMYVKAVFEQKPGLMREVRATSYVDSLIIIGLGSAQRHKMKIYAVSRTEKASKGINIDVDPLTPPIVTVAESLTSKMDFGGFALEFQNPDSAPVYFNIYYKNDETYEQELHDIIFTERSSGVFKIRGLKSLPTNFTVNVTDRWGNKSEPYDFELTPRKEVELNGNSFLQYTINGVDVANWANYGGTWKQMFDGNFGLTNFGHVLLPTNFPHSTTIDLGVSVILSRMKLWQYAHREFEFYAHGAPRRFQIWGCPAGADFMQVANYTLLIDATMVKPSGGGFTDPNTEEDVQALMDGHEFEFDSPPTVRYLRFVSLETWSGMLCTRVVEMKFWGDPQ